MSDKDDDKIELIEESASVKKERVVTGRVRVTTSSNIIEELAQASLSGERVEVTRHRLTLDVDAFPEARVEGDITIIPVVKRSWSWKNDLFWSKKFAFAASLPQKKSPSRSRCASSRQRLNALKNNRRKV